MILVTSANGNVGREVTQTLARQGAPVRAFVHTLPEPGKQEPSVEYSKGDFFEPETLRRAMDGVERVFHIGPPHHPGEFAIGQAVIDAAMGGSRDKPLRHFVFLSALHPFIEALPAHRMKLLVQQYLVDSGLPFTILQPTVFMQNMSVDAILQSGTLAVPYSIETPMSFVDLNDVAQAAALVLSDDEHFRDTYELSGAELLSNRELASILSAETGRAIVAAEIPAGKILQNMPRESAAESYTADTFERMFMYYNRHGLTGNSKVLGWLLGRKPASFRDYVCRSLAQQAATAPVAGS